MADRNVWAGRLYLAGRAWLNSPERAQAATIAAVLDTDPPKDAKIVLPASIGARRPVILLFDRPCSSTEENMAEVKRVADNGMAVRVVLPIKPRALAGTWIESRYKNNVLPDGDGDLFRSLNAGFLPRCYLIGEGGRIIWRSRSVATSWQALLAEASRQLKESKG